MPRITITHKRIETITLEMEIEVPEGREHDHEWIAQELDRQITPEQRAVTDHLTGSMICGTFEVSPFIVNGKATITLTYQRELPVPAIRPLKSVVFTGRVLASQP